MTTPAIDEAEQTRRGVMIAELLCLRKYTVLNETRYHTEGGDKTALGLFRTMQRLIEKGE